MRRKHLLWLAPWVALGLGACATVPRPEAAQACAEWRWIGISRPQGTCPDIPGWEKPRPLFASLAAARVEASSYDKETRVSSPAADPKVLQQLERFCVYEPDKKPGRAAFPPTASGKLVRIDQDCAAIAAAGDTSGTMDWKSFSDHFLAQAGRPVTPLAINNQRGVRLAFLDTHPTFEGVPPAPPKGEGTSEHGYTLAHIARNLICSPESSDRCAALITTRLALPIRRFDAGSQDRTWIDTENGGHIGLQSHLAEAIRKEVDDWLEDRRNEGAPQHLVLNLSVAWDGELFGGLDEAQIAEMRAGTQAVYWALRYAAEFDVLVLAAAGNAKDCEGQTDGPLLPAAWERGAPADESCHGRTAPLVYAVGGVDSQGLPLVNARPRGMPRRAANGEYAVVPALNPGESTTMYTGTSVASAVVSSIAAVVWDTLPRENSSQIMKRLDESETPLDLTADFWFDPGTASAAQAPRVHMLSLCAALEKACRPGAPGCPLRSACEPPWKARRFVPPVALLEPVRRRSCHPWLAPQPENDPCPVCNPPRLIEQ